MEPLNEQEQQSNEEVDQEVESQDAEVSTEAQAQPKRTRRRDALNAMIDDLDTIIRDTDSRAETKEKCLKTKADIIFRQLDMKMSDLTKENVELKKQNDALLVELDGQPGDPPIVGARAKAASYDQLQRGYEALKKKIEREEKAIADAEAEAKAEQDRLEREVADKKAEEARLAKIAKEAQERQQKIDAEKATKRAEINRQLAALKKDDDSLQVVSGADTPSSRQICVELIAKNKTQREALQKKLQDLDKPDMPEVKTEVEKTLTPEEKRQARIVEIKASIAAIHKSRMGNQGTMLMAASNPAFLREGDEALRNLEAELAVLEGRPTPTPRVFDVEAYQRQRAEQEEREFTMRLLRAQEFAKNPY